MKAKKITKNTDNRGEFNRAYKRYLERTGKIKCSYCPYNKIENFKNKHYGGFNNDDLKYPNWKLVSKKRKQWMGKPIKFKYEPVRYNKNIYYVDIVW